MKPGDIVTIYHDPITRQHKEGKAKLIHHHELSDKDQEYWEVEFIDDPGTPYTRWIEKESTT